MLKDIIEVQPLENYRLRVQFEDGVEGIVDIAGMIRFTGVFAPLKDPAFFVQVGVNPELGTICWPNDADIDPDVLYSRVTGQPITFEDKAWLEPTHQR